MIPDTGLPTHICHTDNAVTERELQLDWLNWSFVVKTANSAIRFHCDFLTAIENFWLTPSAPRPPLTSTSFTLSLTRCHSKLMQGISALPTVVPDFCLPFCFSHSLGGKFVYKLTPFFCERKIVQFVSVCLCGCVCVGVFVCDSMDHFISKGARRIQSAVLSVVFCYIVHLKCGKIILWTA